MYVGEANVLAIARTPVAAWRADCCYDIDRSCPSPRRRPRLITSATSSGIQRCVAGASVAAVVACGAGHAKHRSARRGVGRHHPRVVVAAANEPDSVAEEESGPDQEADKPKTWRGRLAAWWRSNAKVDRNTLSKMGLLCLLSYGFVSNVNSALLTCASTYRAVAVTGASPLNSSAALKQFGITYAGLYVFSNLLRPLRIAIALAIAPVFERCVASLQDFLKCKRWVAITITVVALNIVLTIAIFLAGFKLVSALTGVPVHISQLGTLAKAGKAARASAA